MTRKSLHHFAFSGSLVGVLLFATMPVTGQQEATSTTVRVVGGLVSGTTAGGVRSYKGIPFAAPPTGNLRWTPPQPVQPWTGTRSGLEVGPACPQVPRPPNSISNDPREPQSETACISTSGPEPPRANSVR